MNVLDFGAFFFATLYVFLAARNILWCWFFGAISCALFSYVAYQSTFYFDSALNVFYVGAAVWGFMRWRATEQEEKNIIHASQNQLIFGIVFGVLCTGIMYGLNRYFESNKSFLDAFTTAFSIVATYYTGKRILENWYLWLIINPLIAYLFYSQHLWFSAATYIIYFLFSIWGLYTWKKQVNLS